MTNLNTFDRILLYLYQHQDNDDFIELFCAEFCDVEKNALRQKANELEKKGRIQVKRTGPLAVSFFSNRGHSTTKLADLDASLQAKIKLDGVEYVKSNILNEMDDKTERKIEITNHGQINNLNAGDVSGDLSQRTTTKKEGDGLIKQIVIGIIIGLAVLLIGYYIFGIS